MNETVSPPATERTLRSGATQLAIVDTAERLFRTLGYQKTTVADVARELRMSPANVYRFYASKSAINEAVCARILTGLQERLWAIARGAGTPEARLRNFFLQSQSETLALFFHEIRVHDMVVAAMEEHWGVIDTFLQEIEKALRHIIMDGQASGRFARGEPDQLAGIVHMAMLCFAHPTVVAQCGTQDQLPQQAAAMAEFVLRGLRRNSDTDDC